MLPETKAITIDLEQVLTVEKDIERAGVFSCRSLTVLNSSGSGDGSEGDDGQSVRVGEGP